MIHSVGELNLIWSENWFILSGFERANFSLSARWMSNISGRRRASTTAQPRALDNTFNKRGDSTRAAPFWFELIGEWIYPFIVNLRSLTGLVSPSMASAGISRRPTRVVTSVEEHWRWIARGGGGGGRRRSRTTNFNWQECGGPAVRTWSLGLSGFPFFDFFFFPFFLYVYIYIYIFPPLFYFIPPCILPSTLGLTLLLPPPPPTYWPEPNRYCWIFLSGLFHNGHGKEEERPLWIQKGRGGDAARGRSIRIEYLPCLLPPTNGWRWWIEAVFRGVAGNNGCDAMISHIRTFQAFSTNSNSNGRPYWEIVVFFKKLFYFLKFPIIILFFPFFLPSWNPQYEPNYANPHATPNSEKIITRSRKQSKTKKIVMILKREQEEEKKKMRRGEGEKMIPAPTRTCTHWSLAEGFSLGDVTSIVSSIFHWFGAAQLSRSEEVVAIHFATGFRWLLSWFLCPTLFHYYIYIYIYIIAIHFDSVKLKVWPSKLRTAKRRVSEQYLNCRFIWTGDF